MFNWIKNLFKSRREVLEDKFRRHDLQLFRQLVPTGKPELGAGISSLINPKLLECAMALNLEAGLVSCKSNLTIQYARALYFPYHDAVVLVEYFCKSSPDRTNMVVAHELIHATGHPSRLHRPSLVNYRVDPRNNRNSEEVVAQYGAYLLLKALNIASVDDKTDLDRFLTGMWRPLKVLDIKPEERRHAIEAAKFILDKIEFYGTRQETKEAA